jgi:hypothetical protein
MTEMRNAYKILVRNPEGKRPLDRPRNRWEGDTKRFFGKWGGRVWIGFI